MRLRFMLWIFALVTGCSFTSTSSSTGDLKMGWDADKSCNGSGSRDDDGGHSEWTKSNNGILCHIVAAWNGNLVDMAKVRTKVEEELKKNGTSIDKVDVSFKKIDLTFIDPFLNPALPVSSIEVKVAVGKDQIVDKMATDVNALFDGTPITVPSSTLSAALDAFKKKTPLTASGNTSFDVPLASLPVQSEAGSLEVQLKTDVTSEVTVNQL